jgi:glutathione S-transferase
MLTVHHLEHSRSHRILWLLEELEVPYELQVYERDPRTLLAPAALRELHPLGKAPIVTRGTDVWAESGAIIETLVEELGEGRLRPPPGSPEDRLYRYFMHYAEGSAMAPMLLHVVFSELPRQGPALGRPLLAAVSRAVRKKYIRGQIKLHMDFWESEFSSRPYVAGEEFTAADIQMSFPVLAYLARGGGGDEYPKVEQYADRLRDRAGFQRAVERGGPPL